MTDIASAIARYRTDLDQSIPIKQRAKNFWAAVVCSRELASPDVITREFKQLAEQTRLTADLTDPHRRLDGQATVEHLIRWGLFNRNPFG